VRLSNMKAPSCLPSISRRILLSTAAALPALSELVVAAAAKAQAPAEVLPSWNDGPAKQAVIEFVRATTTQGGPNFVPPGERIAEFDQDGTLWVEHPMYTQIVYCLEHVGELVRAKPELKDREPFKTVLTGDREAMAKLSMDAVLEIVLAVQSGMTVESFRDDVKQWLATARHPRWNRPYTELVYQPMLEVLGHLRANGYKTFIATGGTADFVREYSDKVYGIPPEQVAGTTQPVKYGYGNDRRPILTMEPKFALNNLGAGKIENFWMVYGDRPYAAFGNSSSDDQQMLEYVRAGTGARLSGLVVHDDAAREYAYGPALGLPNSGVGTLSQAMYDMAKQQGWAIISMKNDWKRIFPFDH
jgi:phosphoglycolate phosphatase-like HAD superfamily hydrolase